MSVVQFGSGSSRCDDSQNSQFKYVYSAQCVNDHANYGIKTENG